MFDLVPKAPADLPDEQRGRGDLLTRYEDIAQDGRMGVRPLSHSLGTSLWRKTLVQHPAAQALAKDDLVPILSRVVVETGGGPLSVRGSVQCEGAFAISSAVDARGETRYRLDCWTTIDGPRDRTWGPKIEGAGERIPIGALYAEHVLTRPFGPPERRKVQSLPVFELPIRKGEWAEPDAVLALPDGARFLDEDFVVDGTRTVFGLGHTDSNQHVNSLVYPQLLEDAALRRLAAHGLPFDRFATRFEMAYRKPSFAGDRLTLSVRVYERTLSPARVVHGVAGVFATAEEHARGLERARVFGTLELEP